MKIYTKRGDTGETDLFGAGRVSKDDLRVETYGTVDECNAALGMARSILVADKICSEIDAILMRIQNELFCLGSELAAPGMGDKLTRITHDEITQLEHEIDRAQNDLTPLKHFILPMGVPASATLHFARTVARRAERLLVQLHHRDTLRLELIEYMNRLSDHLFVMARWCNHRLQMSDTIWLGREKQK